MAQATQCMFDRCWPKICCLEYEHYNPVGYTLSSAKDKDFTTIQKRKTAMNKRRVRFKQMLTRRVIYNG